MIDVAPLVGMRVRVRRAINGPCAECGENAVTIGAGTGPHAASLRCAYCNRHRGWLPKALTEFLLEMIRLFGPLPDGITVRNTEFAQASEAAPLGAIAASQRPHPEPKAERDRNVIRN